MNPFYLQTDIDTMIKISWSKNIITNLRFIYRDNLQFSDRSKISREVKARERKEKLKKRLRHRKIVANIL